MGWEQRGRRRYYYAKRRIGRSVTSEYIGAGAVGERGELDRERRKIARQALQSERATQGEIDRAIDDAGDALRAAVCAVLVASGYHQHKRQWRRRRDR